MKLKQAVLFLFLLNTTLLYALDKAKYTYPMGKSEILQNSILLWSVNSIRGQKKLQEIKFNIINGNLNLAKIQLKEADITTDFTKSIQLRYLAIIYFIEGNYPLVLETLSKPEMLDFSVQAKVCFMRVLSQIILNKTEQATLSWKLCREATSIYSNSDLKWMQIIVDLKTSKDKNYIEKVFQDVVIDNVDEKMLRIYLKLALFLNQQDKIIPRFKYFSEAPLRNKTQRELIGLNYYRNGNLVKAHQLLENLNTANAEVFKGNLYLAQKNYELAFAQYKLALKRKSNSRNALDRLLPLSWKLNQWNEGVNFLQRIPLSEDELLEHYTLMAAFLTMFNKPNAVENYIKRVQELTNKSEPIEVSQINVLNSLILKKYDQIEDAAANSCAARDAMNCWLLIALNSWDDFLEYTNKDKPIHANQADLIEQYTNGPRAMPIQEESLINQKDIEELDNNLIKLIDQI